MAKIEKFLGLLGLLNKTEERMLLIGNDASGTVLHLVVNPVNRRLKRT